VTLEVFDAARRLVRRYSSDDKPDPIDKELNVPTYWIRPTAILPREAGMHRFVWDLHYSPPDALQHDYPISAIYGDTPRFPLGVAALPGEYTVKLTVAGKSYTQPLTVKMDPRVKTPATGLLRQFTLATKITEMMHRDYEALQEVRVMRGKWKQQDPQLDKQAEALEGPGGGSLGGNSDGGDTLPSLNSDLSTVLEVIEGADAAPTTQAVAAIAELERTLRMLLSKVQDLRSKVK
jgi:hypothetical protein